MEETFGGLVAEIEKAVRPLGFSVNSVFRKGAVQKLFSDTESESEMEKAAADNAELVITVVRKGRLG